MQIKQTSKRQIRQTAHSRKKSNEKDIKDKSPGTTLKNRTNSNQDILKPTKINSVNSGRRKMINDCDHKCPKAVGFTYPGVVLQCSECELKKKKINKVKHECIDEVISMESMKEVKRKFMSKLIEFV